MRTKSEKVRQMDVSKLSDEQLQSVQGGTSVLKEKREEYTYDGGTLEEVVVTPKR